MEERSSSTSSLTHCTARHILARAVLKGRGPAAAGAGVGGVGAGGGGGGGEGESQAENVNWRPPLLPCLLHITSSSSPFCRFSSSLSFLNRMRIVRRNLFGFHFPMEICRLPKIHFSQEIWRASFSSVPVASKLSEKSGFTSSVQKKMKKKMKKEDELKRLGLPGICPATHFNLNRWQL